LIGEFQSSKGTGFSHWLPSWRDCRCDRSPLPSLSPD
jgi:hypothetical protein